MQHGPESGIGTQGPDEISARVLRAGEQAVGTDSRVAAKNGEAAFKAARLRQDRLFAAPESFPNGRALRNAQTAEAIRLQQLHQSIRNLEASISAKRKYFALKRTANFFSRLFGRRMPNSVRVVEKLAAAVDRRSLREMQDLLFKIRAQYSAAHKLYVQIHGFNSYANRIAGP